MDRTMKTYVGILLPEPDGRHDTSNETAVLVVTAGAGDAGERYLMDTEPLEHVCHSATERGRLFRNKYGCHSPSGFSWGYGGSGPADLALCILLDMGLSDRIAWQLHQSFKTAHIATLAQGKPWQLDDHQVADWLAGVGCYLVRSSDGRYSFTADARPVVAKTTTITE
jgi:hypothetical protein